MRKVSSSLSLIALDVVIIVALGYLFLHTLAEIAPSIEAKPLNQGERPLAYDIKEHPALLDNGPTVEIIVRDTDFSMQQCRNLIARYRHLILVTDDHPKGDIAVYKVIRQSSNATSLPWCVESSDSADIVFKY
ncbi:MAG: hypothetical protein AAF629_33380 [Chloroflexota bacterium]